MTKLINVTSIAVELQVIRQADGTWSVYNYVSGVVYPNVFDTQADALHAIQRVVNAAKSL